MRHCGTVFSCVCNPEHLHAVNGQRYSVIRQKP